MSTLSALEGQQTTLADSRTKLAIASLKDNVQGTVTLRGTQRKLEDEVVPDSEEERTTVRLAEHAEVITISSDSESEVEKMLQTQKTNCRVPGRFVSDSEDEEMPTKYTLKTPRTARRFPLSRKVIESSESDHSECESPTKPVRPPKGPLVQQEVIELTSSSESEEEKAPAEPLTTIQIKSPPKPLVPYLSQVDDGAILIFDEPKSARKPVRTAAPKQRSPSKKTQARSTVNDDDSVNQYTPSLLSNISTPKTRTQRTKAPGSTVRLTKKAIREAEETRLHECAETSFVELNKVVFGNGLPEDTKLLWNKRLVSTAGKAKYHRSREGVVDAVIELSTKILDCEERIRNTLSHEMCHLATWVIDKKLDENHGKLFRYWGSKVMKKMPDIEITTRHNYEISYPFNWECEKCQKTYGRFSKSIRPDECVCGSCKEGRLKPLFTVRSRVQTPKVSRLAAEKAQDSPRTLSSQPPTAPEVSDEDDLQGGDNPEIEALALTMGITHIA